MRPPNFLPLLLFLILVDVIAHAASWEDVIEPVLYHTLETMQAAGERAFGNTEQDVTRLSNRYELVRFSTLAREVVQSYWTSPHPIQAEVEGYFRSLQASVSKCLSGNEVVTKKKVLIVYFTELNRLSKQQGINHANIHRAWLTSSEVLNKLFWSQPRMIPGLFYLAKLAASVDRMPFGTISSHINNGWLRYDLLARAAEEATALPATSTNLLLDLPLLSTRDQIYSNLLKGKESPEKDEKLLVERFSAAYITLNNKYQQHPNYQKLSPGVMSGWLGVRMPRSKDLNRYYLKVQEVSRTEEVPPRAPYLDAKLWPPGSSES